MSDAVKNKEPGNPSVWAIYWRSIKSGKWVIRSIETSEGQAKHAARQLMCETKIEEMVLSPKKEQEEKAS